jgi:hypothetical protein
MELSYLESLSRKELMALAKEKGLKANRSSLLLRQELMSQSEEPEATEQMDEVMMDKTVEARVAYKPYTAGDLLRVLVSGIEIHGTIVRVNKASIRVELENGEQMTVKNEKVIGVVATRTSVEDIDQSLLESGDVESEIEAVVKTETETRVESEIEVVSIVNAGFEANINVIGIEALVKDELTETGIEKESVKEDEEQEIPTRKSLDSQTKQTVDIYISEFAEARHEYDEQSESRRVSLDSDTRDIVDGFMSGFLDDSRRASQTPVKRASSTGENEGDKNVSVNINANANNDESVDVEVIVLDEDLLREMSEDKYAEETVSQEVQVQVTEKARKVENSPIKFNKCEKSPKPKHEVNNKNKKIIKIRLTKAQQMRKEAIKERKMKFETALERANKDVFDISINTNKISSTKSNAYFQNQPSSLYNFSGQRNVKNKENENENIETIPFKARKIPNFSKLHEKYNIKPIKVKKKIGKFNHMRKATTRIPFSPTRCF